MTSGLWGSWEDMVWGKLFYSRVDWGQHIEGGEQKPWGNRSYEVSRELVVDGGIKAEVGKGLCQTVLSLSRYCVSWGTFLCSMKLSFITVRMVPSASLLPVCPKINCQHQINVSLYHQNWRLEWSIFINPGLDHLTWDPKKEPFYRLPVLNQPLFLWTTELSSMLSPCSSGVSENQQHQNGNQWSRLCKNYLQHGLLGLKFFSFILALCTIFQATRTLQLDWGWPPYL